MNEQEYIDYFQNLASQHASIKHAEQNEAFFVVRDDNHKEVEQAVKDRLSFPCLLLDQYMDDEDTEHDNNRLMIMGGISVLCKLEKGFNATDIRAARHEARQIAQSIIRRVRKEIRTPGSKLFGLKVVMSPQTQGEPTDVVNGMATGWGYGFSWTMPTKMVVNSDDWLDLLVSTV